LPGESISKYADVGQVDNLPPLAGYQPAPQEPVIPEPEPVKTEVEPAPPEPELEAVAQTESEEVGPEEAVAEEAEPEEAVTEEATSEEGADEEPPADSVEPARIPTSLTAQLREQGGRYPHRLS